MSAWDVYWRAGYTVKGSSPVRVTEYERVKDRAGTNARNAADEAIRHLAALGIGADVTVWVQRWKTRQIEESDALEVVEVVKVDRATPDIVQARYEDSLARVAGDPA